MAPWASARKSPLKKIGVRGMLEQAEIVLVFSALLPEILRIPHTRTTLIAQHVRVPLAPVAGAPRDWHRWQMNDVTCWRFLNTAAWPGLNGVGNKRGMRSAARFRRASLPVPSTGTSRSKSLPIICRAQTACRLEAVPCRVRSGDRNKCDRRQRSSRQGPHAARHAGVSAADLWIPNTVAPCPQFSCIVATRAGIDQQPETFDTRVGGGKVFSGQD